MKNKLLLGTLLICIASLFTSCKDDNDDNPTIQSPTSFIVNTPVSTDQYIQLSAENTVHLTWSQADYGYNAQATYNIQVGVVQDDGSIKWCQKDVKDAAGNVIGQTDDYLSTSHYVCSADISGEEVAQAINQVDGVTKVEDFVDKGFRKIAFRVRSALFESLTTLVPGSEIVSNAVFFNYMAAYAAIKAPAFIYLIGSPNSWPSPSPGNAAALEDWKLYETEIGNKVFEGTFDIPAGNLQFRFYTYLDDWGSDDDPMGSVGPQKPDAGIDCVWDENNSYEGTIMPGKGSWKFGGFTGGSVTLTVDLNTNKVKFIVNSN
jgi:hypothetical protein